MENLTQQPAQTPDEVAYWSNEFGISQDELNDAFKAGESYAEAVEKYVRKLELTA